MASNLDEGLCITAVFPAQGEFVGLIARIL